LLEHAGELVTREELRERLWPSNTFVDFEHGLNAAVRRLREALGDSADTPKFIETLPRRGYRFIRAVERAPGTAHSSASIFVQLPTAPKVPSATELAGASGRLSVPMTHATVLRRLLAASIVFAVGMGVWVGRTTRERAAPVPHAATKSMRVTSLAGSEVDENRRQSDPCREN
jgi:DNA-binding winged helix-turn-helix (wHTH) protein